eukprot:7692863-Pyramimonas_sp.AAC.1
MRLRVTEAELETARDGLRVEYDESKQYLNHEKREYEQQIRRARQQRGIAKDQDFERVKAEASDLNFKLQEESEIA